MFSKFSIKWTFFDNNFKWLSFPSFWQLGLSRNHDNCLPHLDVVTLARGRWTWAGLFHCWRMSNRWTDLCPILIWRKFSFPRSWLFKPVLSASNTRKCAAAKFGRSVGCSFRTARASDSRAAGKPGGTVNCPEVRTEDMSKLSKVSLISFQGKR